MRLNFLKLLGFYSSQGERGCVHKYMKDAYTNLTSRYRLQLWTLHSNLFFKEQGMNIARYIITTISIYQNR
jgi:hypothetical protein